jgi:hypothetical protein
MYTEGEKNEFAVFMKEQKFLQDYCYLRYFHGRKFLQNVGTYI